MDNLTALQQERAAKVAEMRTMIDATELRGTPTAEDQASIAKIETAIDALDTRVNNLRSISKLEAAAQDTADELGQRSQAPAGVDTDAATASAEYRDAFVSWLRGTADADDIRSLAQGEFRDQVKGTNTKGGYAAPATFETTLRARIEERSSARQVFKNVLRTVNGNDINLTAEDARGAAAWIDEAAAFTSTDDTFKRITLGAWKAGRLVKASIELVDDTFFDLETYLANSIGESLAALEDAAIYNGDGTNKIRGVLLDAAVGVTAASATLITFDEVIELIFSVRPTYRRNGEFVVADLGVKALRKVKDSTGQYIWQDGNKVGEPDTLRGYKVTTEVNLAAPAANAKPILFGDPSVYQIREVGGVNLAVLRERFLADEGKYGYLGWHRIDGKMLDADGMKVLRMAAS